MKGTIHFK